MTLSILAGHGWPLETLRARRQRARPRRLHRFDVHWSHLQALPAGVRCLAWTRPRAQVDQTVVPQRGHRWACFCPATAPLATRNWLPQTRLWSTCPVPTVLCTASWQNGRVYSKRARVPRGVRGLPTGGATQVPSLGGGSEAIGFACNAVTSLLRRLLTAWLSAALASRCSRATRRRSCASRLFARCAATRNAALQRCLPSCCAARCLDQALKASRALRSVHTAQRQAPLTFTAHADTSVCMSRRPRGDAKGSLRLGNAAFEARLLHGLLTFHVARAVLAHTSVCVARLPRGRLERTFRLGRTASVAPLLCFARPAHAVESALGARVHCCKGVFVLPCLATFALPGRVVGCVVTHAFSAHTCVRVPFPLPGAVPAFGFTFLALAAHFLLAVPRAQRRPVDALSAPGLQQAAAFLI